VTNKTFMIYPLMKSYYSTTPRRPWFES